MARIRKFCASRVEWKYIYQLQESIVDKDIRNYFANQIEWYVIKAERYKILEYALKFATVVMPTLVVIVQKFLEESSPITQLVVLGAATITSASGTFLKLHDKRVLYRKSAEQLKEETMLYINGAGEYGGLDKDKRFVMNLHEISKNTNSKWSEIEEKDEKGESAEKTESAGRNADMEEEKHDNE